MRKMVIHEDLNKAMDILGRLSLSITELSQFNKDNKLTCNEKLEVLDSGLTENYILPQFELMIEGNHKNFFREDKYGNVTLYSYTPYKIAESPEEFPEEETTRFMSVINMGNRNDDTFGLIDPFNIKHLTFDKVIVKIISEVTKQGISKFKYGYFVAEGADEKIL